MAISTNSFIRDLRTGIKAVPARWAQLSHSTAGRKKKLIVTCSALINLSQTFQQGHRIQSEQPGASSHLMQHISELCFFRNSSTAHECLRPCLTRTIATPTSPAAEGLGDIFFSPQDCTCALLRFLGLSSPFSSSPRIHLCPGRGSACQSAPGCLSPCCVSTFQSMLCPPKPQKSKPRKVLRGDKHRGSAHIKHGRARACQKAGEQENNPKSIPLGLSALL